MPCSGGSSFGLRHNAGFGSLPPFPLRRLSSPPVRVEARALWQLAWPILIGQLATVGMSVADVAMAGHASAQDLAGVALGVSIWHIVIISLMGLYLVGLSFVQGVALASS